MNVDLLALYLDVAWLQAGEVDAGNDVAVNQHKEAISCQKVGEDGIFLGAADYFVHGVNHGFEALELLDAVNDRGLADVNAERPTG
jgi:hypothetical protein